MLLVFLWLLPAIGAQSFGIGRENEIYDVIVVGAGLTGLTTARNILRSRANSTVLVLEGRPQMGGRLRYTNMRTSTNIEFVDTGAQFISPTDTLLLGLLEQLGVETSKQLVCGPTTVFSDSRQKREENLFWGNGDLQESLSANYETANQTVTEFASRLSRREADTINRLLQTFFDAPGDDVSALQLSLTTSSQNQSVVDILKNFGHGNSLLVKNGLSEVLRKLADGVEIRYSKDVVSITDSITPTVQTSTGETFNAKQVVLTAPLVTLKNINLSPRPEAAFQGLIDNYKPSGHAYYFTMTFKKAFWRENSKSGQVIYTSRSPPLMWLTTFDVSKEETCGGSSAVLWGIAHFSYEVPEVQRKTLYVQAVSNSLQLENNLPIDVTDVNFSNDKFAMGTIPVLKTDISQNSVSFFSNFYTNAQNVHIANADMSEVSTGTMNGAINAANHVSVAVLSFLQDGEAWNVIARDDPLSERTTVFPYRTSSHYPPELFTSTQRPFVYDTTTHYPPTTTIVPTTWKHFSFGNQVENEAVLAYDQPQQTQNGFVYHTSTVMPPIAPIQATPFIHFSNGNAQTKVQTLPRYLQFDQTSNRGFVYATTAHYTPEQLQGHERLAPSVGTIQSINTLLANASNSTMIEMAIGLTNVLNNLLAQMRTVQ